MSRREKDNANADQRQATPSRQQRRRFERELRKLLKRDGDYCSICRKPFLHNSNTYCGQTEDGKVASVGECCKAKLAWIDGCGLYLAPGHKYEGFGFGNGTGDLYSSPEEALAARQTFQEIVSARDEIAADMAHKGGFHGVIPYLCVEDSPWKTDDKNWFKNHPDRSHRLRPMFPGEMQLPDLPPGQEWHVIVRQVEPGQRIRLPICHVTDGPALPDIEPMLHALCDLAQRDKVIKVKDVAKLALKYVAERPQ